MTGRSAVVLGAGSVIGRAIALTVAQLGASVAAVDRDPLAVARTALLVEPPGDVRDYEADVADAAGFDVVRREIEIEIGVPHIVVEVTGAADAVTGPAVRAFLDGMVRRGRGGRIVLVRGVGAGHGDRDAAVGLTTSLAGELAGDGILVNCVCAGPTDTPLLAAQPRWVRQRLEREIPLRRLAHPDEIAAAVAFFASDRASFVTGQVLSVSGGLTMAR
ncbi:SDR family oxidoreductase [Pseudonocardia sp. S2-4]|uniref:SDR family oxidoreductase n=1 Tax=Pseudonocardia humida TaxID=2800819 RepID=A0ABT0ZZQ3_9PSEU|nr:SDR family oxidoreductase [Pseudonocardia humida]